MPRHPGGWYDPFANASGDEWTIAEIVFMNIAPTFIGGYEGRQAYLNGERCFNDEHAVAAFQAIADIAPYLPDGQEALTYYDSQQLFLLGEAAMWLGGSWDIPFFESEAPDFNWGIFGIPSPEAMMGQRYVTFHMDAGMGLNAAAPEANKEAARLFRSGCPPLTSRPCWATPCPAFPHLQQPGRAERPLRQCVPGAQRRR